MIEIIDSELKLSILSQEWNNLFVLADKVTPFQQFDYVELAWKAFAEPDDSLYIMVVREEEIVSAIFPCYLDKYKILRFINWKHTDFCDALILPAKDNYELYQEVSSFIKKDKNIRKVVFDNLLPSSPLLANLHPVLRLSLLTEENFFSVLPICKKEGDKDYFDTFRHLKSKKKSKLKDSVKKISQNTEFYLHHISMRASYPKQDIEALSDFMVNSGKRSKDYMDAINSFAESLYNCGILHIGLLYIDGRLNAYSYMYRDDVRKEYIGWFICYVESKYNSILNLKTIEYLFNADNYSLNFARGIYDFKIMNYHPNVYPLFRLIIPKNIWDSFKSLFSVNVYYLKVIYRYLYNK